MAKSKQRPSKDRRILEAFRAGMLHAAGLKPEISAHESNGYDRLKSEIRKAAAKLRKLP